MARLNSRREFLTELTGGATLLPTGLAWLGASSPSSAAAEDGELFWEEVRRQFAFPEDKVPMNAANLCPSPRVVADRVTALTHDIDADCSSHNREKFSTLLEESRRKVADQLGVTADEIALVRNTSEANNTINNGLPLAAGDEVVLWDQNHPTNNVAWDVRAARFGVTVTRVATPRHPGSLGELVAVFEEAFTPPHARAGDHTCFQCQRPSASRARAVRGGAAPGNLCACRWRPELGPAGREPS